MFDNIEYITLNNSDYFEFLNGLWTGKKPPFQKIGVIRNTNFTNSGIIDYTDVAYLDVEVKAFEKRKLYPGDIIVERSGGGPKQPVGRVVFFENADENFSFSNFTSTIRCKDLAKVHPKFLHYCLLEFYFFQNIQRFQAQTTGLRNLDFNKYCETVQIPLLPLTEQKKISSILDLIQSSILQQQKIINTVQQLKKNLLHKLFTEGINNEPQKETEIGLMPESWEVKELNEMPEKFIGGGTPSTSVAEYWNGDYWWTTSKRLDEEKIYLEEGEKKVSLEGINNSSTNLIPSGNLIISTRVTVGKAAINKFDMAISQDLTALIIDPSKYNIPFLAYQIKTSRIQDIFHSQKRGATIKGIPREDLKAIKFAIPSTDEQNEIANALITIDKKIELHKGKKQTLEALFKSMLHQLMTGEIRVNELELSKAKEYKLEEDKLTLAAEP